MSGLPSISVGTIATPRVGDLGVSLRGVAGVTTAERLLDAVWADQSAALAALAVGMGLAPDAAADALQDVYLAALRDPPPIADAAGLARWLFRVTANRCRLEHRRRGRWRRMWESLAAAWQGNGHVPHLPTGELRRDVDAALARLDESDRLLVVLRYFANLNSRQIAEIVDEPESTIRGRLRVARQQLAEELTEWRED